MTRQGRAGFPVLPAMLPAPPAIMRGWEKISPPEAAFGCAQAPRSSNPLKSLELLVSLHTPRRIFVRKKRVSAAATAVRSCIALAFGLTAAVGALLAAQTHRGTRRRVAGGGTSASERRSR